MDKRKLIFLRSAETIFLLINAVAITNTNTDGNFVYTINFSFPFISIDPHAIELSISTEVIGYLLSLLGTLYCYKNRKTKLLKASLVMSIMGITSFFLEVLRFFLHYEFQVVIQAGLLLAIIDWWDFRLKQQRRLG